MEKLIKEINDDYEAFEFYGVRDLSECRSYICGKQQKINDYIQNVEYQKDLNRRNFRLSSFLSYIPLIKLCKTPEFFQEDSLDIDLGVQISIDYLRYYDKLFEIVSDSNYEDVGKLASFIGKMYKYNISQLEENRVGRERYYCGEEDVSVCQLISKELIDEFLEEKISCLSKDKVSVKVKK